MTTLDSECLVHSVEHHPFEAHVSPQWYSEDLSSSPHYYSSLLYQVMWPFKKLLHIVTHGKLRLDSSVLTKCFQERTGPWFILLPSVNPALFSN